MRYTTWKTIYRFGVSVLLFAFTLWVPMPACADAGTAPKDLTHVRALAEKGSIRDEIALAGYYFVGKGVAQDSKMAAHWYEKAAGHGSPEAQNEIGYFYEAGIGVPQDFKRALHWYQLSAASGCASAKVNVAIAYLRGLGVQKNGELAVRLLDQAFQQGNGTAATYLGLLYYFGITVKEDKDLAEKWFESGLKLHDPLAAYNLGSLYSVSAGHPHDMAKAAELQRLAANAGYVPAMHALGLLLVKHPELTRNTQETRALLEAAAKAGSWKSSITLGILARDGRGTPVDNKAAYFHFLVAVLQGGEDANSLVKNDIDVLAAKISEQERQTTNSAAKAWHEHYPAAFAFVYKEGTNSDFPAAAMMYSPDGSPAGQLVPLASS
jgi:TPR repeat protein